MTDRASQKGARIQQGRQILGHRSLSTTIRCYIWLKNIQAHQIYQKMVRKRLKIDPEGDND